MSKKKMYMYYQHYTKLYGILCYAHIGHTHLSSIRFFISVIRSALSIVFDASQHFGGVQSSYKNKNKCIQFKAFDEFVLVQP